MTRNVVTAMTEFGVAVILIVAVNPREGWRIFDEIVEMNARLNVSTQGMPGMQKQNELRRDPERAVILGQRLIFAFISQE